MTAGAPVPTVATRPLTGSGAGTGAGTGIGTGDTYSQKLPHCPPCRYATSSPAFASGSGGGVMQRSRCGTEQALVAAKTFVFFLAAETLLSRLDFLSSSFLPFFILSLAIYPASDSLGFRYLSLTLKLSFFRQHFQSQEPLPTSTTVPSSDLTLLSPPTKSSRTCTAFTLPTILQLPNRDPPITSRFNRPSRRHYLRGMPVTVAF